MKSLNNGSNLFLKMSFEEAHLIAEGLRRLAKEDERAEVLLDQMLNKNVVDTEAKFTHKDW